MPSRARQVGGFAGTGRASPSLSPPAYFAASAGGAPIIKQYAEQPSERFLRA
jgi:hypothetical protein